MITLISFSLAGAAGAALLIRSLCASAARADRALDRFAAHRKAKRSTLFLVTAPTAEPPDVRAEAARLTAPGRDVITMTPFGADDPEAAARRDLAALLKCDAVAVARTWRFWRHPRLLVAAADALGLPILMADDLKPVPPFYRRLIVTEVDGACECDRDTVAVRVGELWGRDAEASLRRIN